MLDHAPNWQMRLLLTTRSSRTYLSGERFKLRLSEILTKDLCHEGTGIVDFECASVGNPGDNMLVPISLDVLKKLVELPRKWQFDSEHVIAKHQST